MTSQLLGHPITYVENPCPQHWRTGFSARRMCAAISVPSMTCLTARFKADSRRSLDETMEPTLNLRPILRFHAEALRHFGGKAPQLAGRLGRGQTHHQHCAPFCKEWDTRHDV